MKHSELDVVVLAEDLPGDGLTTGMTGTVIMVFDTPVQGYLVEFCDEEGRTIATSALTSSQLTGFPAD